VAQTVDYDHSAHLVAETVAASRANSEKRFVFFPGHEVGFFYYFLFASDPIANLANWFSSTHNFEVRFFFKKSSLAHPTFKAEPTQATKTRGCPA